MTFFLRGESPVDDDMNILRGIFLLVKCPNVVKNIEAFWAFPEIGYNFFVRFLNMISMKKIDTLIKCKTNRHDRECREIPALPEKVIINFDESKHNQNSRYNICVAHLAFHERLPLVR